MTAASSRWLGLDALRGLSMLAMILVNNPGRWGAEWQYEPLRHALWHGCTMTDLVFPTFLFVAGVSIVPAMANRLQQGSRRALLGGVVRRSLSLVLLGLLLAAFPLVTPWSPDGWFHMILEVRIPGVLQRIGVCYGITAALYLFTTPRTQRLVLWGCLLGYWPLLVLGSDGIDDPATTINSWVDGWVFGANGYRPNEPEGVVSTLGALATCLLGVEAGRQLRANPDPAARALVQLRTGALLMAAGAVWSWFLPLNKALWTSSYVLWTAGIATTGLGLCVWAFEDRRWTRLAWPLQTYGMNALLVFMGSGVLARILWRIKVTGADDDRIALQFWFFKNVLQPLGPPQLTSLLYSLLWVTGWFVVLVWLRRRGIVWKV